MGFLGFSFTIFGFWIVANTIEERKGMELGFSVGYVWLRLKVIYAHTGCDFDWISVCTLYMECLIIDFGCGTQKARLARIRIAKASSGAAFVSKKKAVEARLAAQESGLEIDDGKDEDIFELQHHHLLRCLEKTTVSSIFRVHGLSGLMLSSVCT